MEVFWNVPSDGLIANETDEYLTFSDGEGSFFFFIIGVYQFGDTEQKLKLIAEIKQQIGNDNEETTIMIDTENIFVGLNNKTTECIYSLLGFKVGSCSITKFAASFEEFDTKEKVVPIIHALEEELQP